VSATRRAVAAYLGAALCVLWAILTAWHHWRRRPVLAGRPAGEDGWGLGV